MNIALYITIDKSTNFCSYTPSRRLLLNLQSSFNFAYRILLCKTVEIFSWLPRTKSGSSTNSWTECLPKERTFTKAVIVPVFPSMVTKIMKQMQTKIMQKETDTPDSVVTSSEKTDDELFSMLKNLKKSPATTGARTSVYTA